MTKYSPSDELTLSTCMDHANAILALAMSMDEKTAGIQLMKRTLEVSSYIDGIQFLADLDRRYPIPDEEELPFD